MKRSPKSVNVAQIERLVPSAEFGLTEEQASARAQQGQVNEDKVRAGKSYGEIVFKNIFTFFNLLCIAVAVVLISVGLYTDCFFMVIVLANCLIAIVQEVRAKRTVEKLSIMTAPTVEVVRGGVKKIIPSCEAVLSDVCIYRRDKQICADGEVISGEISVNESMLTGESDDVIKRPGDRVFAGSFVTGGSCRVLCTAVGKDNYVSELSRKAKKMKRNVSPILKTLNKIIKVISFIILPIGGMVAVNKLLGGAGYIEIIGTGAGAVIGMIPSGMFLLTSATLAVGVVKLALKKTLVQDLYCIEMLARCDTLCLDKTGTITDGTMTVTDVIPFSESERIPDILFTLLMATGDDNATARALKQHFVGGGVLDIAAAASFNSAYKRSGVETKDGTYVLGAAEFALKEPSKELTARAQAFMEEGKRVLVLGFTDEKIVNGVCPKADRIVALIALCDHIREQAADTIRWFNENRVAVKLISGDDPLTVSRIAARCGIAQSGKYISLSGLTDEEVADAADKYTVFGRVSPGQKALLVHTMRTRGKTVAMTGDGVNDILAFKEADCSIAMASGSDAARSVASLVLLDSDFSNMPRVVAEGRRVVNNIQKASSMYLMKTLFVMLVALVTLGGYQFYPRHLSLLGLTVIGIPTFFLAMQPNNRLIEGNFLESILKSAIPAGLVLFLNFMGLHIASLFAGIDEGQLLTMQALSVTYAGLAMLLIVCFPYNLYRGVLAAAMAILTTLIAIFFSWFFNFSPLLLWQYLALGGMFLLSIGLGVLLRFAASKVRIAVKPRSAGKVRSRLHKGIEK